MPTPPADTFLGRPIEICLVTRDHKRTLAGLSSLGIGPWRIYTFTPANTSNQTYMGSPSAFTLRVCFAEPSGFAGSGVVYEVIEPVSGPNIFDRFLEEHGEGIHHVAYDCGGLPWEERVQGFERRGYRMVQGGNFMEGNMFAFFGTEGRTGTCFETILFEKGWVVPEPEEWFPAKGGEDVDGRQEKKEGKEEEKME